MTQCARSRPLQPVRQAAVALPAQSPSCRRGLVSAPRTLTASPTGGLHPFGAALLLLRQGSEAWGGQAVLGSEQTRSSCVNPLPLLTPQNTAWIGKRGSSACKQRGFAWQHRQQDDFRKTRLWKFKSQMNSSLLPQTQGGYWRLSSILTKILRRGVVCLLLPMFIGLLRLPALFSLGSQGILPLLQKELPPPG